MKTYDKAAWHIDGGENPTDVIHKFEHIYEFLNRHDMLTEDGKEILDAGIDDSAALTSNDLTPAGRYFVEDYYDSLINLTVEELQKKLNSIVSL